MDESMPGEEYKYGNIRISRTAAVIAICAYGSSLLLVGLLCGLLPAGPTCNIAVPADPVDPAYPVPTEEPIEPTEPSVTTVKEMTTQRAEPTPSPTGPPQPWDSLRLPTDLVPSHYDIELRIDIDSQQMFEGSISIIMECKQSTDLLLLHSKELEIVQDSWSLTSADDGAAVPLKGSPRTFPENQYLIVELSEMLTAGKNYTFTVSFKAPLEDGLVGLYRSSYQAGDGSTKLVI